MKDRRSQTAVLKKVIRYVRNYWAMLILSLLLSILYVAMSLYIPILVGHSIDAMIGPLKVDFAQVSHDLLQILGCATAAAAFQWIISAINNRVTFQVSRDIRNEAFRHIQQLPVSYLDHHAHGDLVNRVTSDTDIFADGLLMGFTQLFTGLMIIAGTLIFMIRIHWIIALVVMIITPVSLLVANFIAKKTFFMFQEQNGVRGEQAALIDEIIGSVKTVQAFNHEKKSLEQFDKINERLKTSSLKAVFFSSLTNPCTRFVNSLVYAGVGLAGALLAIQGRIGIGALTTFLNYANQYSKPFNEISGVITELQNALACAGRVFELIEQPSQSPDPVVPQCPAPVNGRIDICNLKFSYYPEQTLIEQFNLSAYPGMRIAIVGPTGCGKTTFLNLLMRFYDPDMGKILLDGIDIRQMRRADLRNCVGMVLQDTWIKTGTVRENIAMGKPNATDQEIINAAKKAYAHSFIMRLPSGYNTVIGEGSGNLSQGQKQLLCIARVMLCQPPMLFLDEATSSIDTRTEIKLQQAFRVIMQGRTSFIAAHRLSTIQEADLILVMENGKIVERGTHQELLKMDGFYAKLYESQFAF